MLNKLRDFSKGKLAAVLVAIIIIPFVFWGMGSVFSGGNTNSVAKINNHNVSTQDFVDFVNKSKIESDVLKQNIENNVLEELLTRLVSTLLIDLEISDLNIYISDKTLAKHIRNQSFFKDQDNSFSRVKYEKYLIENNMTSVGFEQAIKKNELKKKLFLYISGGVKSPYFLINKTYRDKTKKIEIDYIDLRSSYIDENQIKKEDIDKYISENKEKFLVDNLDIAYVKITPEILTQENEFTENFFTKIDEIENLVLNNENIKNIASKYNLKINNVNNYNLEKNTNNKNLEEIYKKKDLEKIQLIDKNDYFLLYEILNSQKILPSINDDKFLIKVKNQIINEDKYNLHTDLIKKIQLKKFTNEEFVNLSKNNIQNLKINSINDKTIFEINSLKLLYTLSKNNFSLVADNENNVYLAKVKNVEEENLIKNSTESNSFYNQTNIIQRDNLYNTYDYLLNEKYKIEVNEKTLERIKNYFR